MKDPIRPIRGCRRNMSDRRPTLARCLDVLPSTLHFPSVHLKLPLVVVLLVSWLCSASTTLASPSIRLPRDVISYSTFTANDRSYDISYISTYSPYCDGGLKLEQTDRLWSVILQGCNGTEQAGGKDFEVPDRSGRPIREFLVFGAFVSPGAAIRCLIFRLRNCPVDHIEPL